ncbi:MAG: alpha/beta fold hydrolase [Ktedonobacteraceae bacterium]
MSNSTNDIIRRRHIKLGDVELELWEGGQGRPVFYLHGGHGFDPTAPFVNQLCKRFRLIAPSHPGFGGSSLPLWMDSIDDFAHLYLELIQKIRLENIILVGSSIGGWIAAEMATKSTQHLASMILVAPVGIKVGPRDRLDVPDIFAMSQEKLNKLLYRHPALGVINSDSKSDKELETIARNRETLALVAWEPYMHNPKLKHRLHCIHCPTLFLRGDSDGLVSKDYVLAFAELVPGASVDIVSEAGHAPQRENPNEFVRKVAEFAEASSVDNSVSGEEP